jgi:hypothetical protein
MEGKKNKSKSIKRTLTPKDKKSKKVIFMPNEVIGEKNELEFEEKIK